MSKLTKAGQRHETGHHQHRMQIELQFRIFIPGETAAIVDHPKERQHQGADQQNGGQNDDQQILEPRAAAPFVFDLLIVAPINRREI